jgi:hypothetical protein
MKQIDLKKSVYELCQEYPELLELLNDIGFHDIQKPGMLNTVGRFMTIPKGATAKKIDLDLIKKELEKHDFVLKA